MDSPPKEDRLYREIEEDQEDKTEPKKQRRKQQLLKEIADAEKKGVCYLSRVPPHLRPLKLRHLLSQYGEILRIYLAPEDPAIRIRRKKSGKSRGKNFTEGWVEFAKKSVAKRVARMLNGEPMGGNRRSSHYYDLWNIKYLRKFKWDNLTEEVAYKNAVREQKLAAEISAAKRERDFYLGKVDQFKAIRAMEERKKKQRVEGSLPQVEGHGDPTNTLPAKIMRHFPQKKSVHVPELDSTARLSKELLAGVFGK
eukprot:c24710_g1_i2 orf=145-903(+)